MSAHHDEQQELENAKHLWHSGGKWVVVALVVVALGYLGNVIYKGQVKNAQIEAAQMASQVKGDAAKLADLQSKYGKTTIAAQETLNTAAALFKSGKLDEAAAAYRWVLSNHQEPIFQAVAMQNLANVLLQQKKYDDALTVLNTPVDESFAALINETKGDVFSAQGKSKEAVDAYKLALDKLPADSPSRQLVQLKMGQ